MKVNQELKIQSQFLKVKSSTGAVSIVELSIKSIQSLVELDFQMLLNQNQVLKVQKGTVHYWKLNQAHAVSWAELSL